MRIILTLALALLLGGCARSFHPVNLEALPYKPSTLSPEIGFAYSRSALIDSRNGRYANRAISSRTDIVAVKLQNKSDHPLSVKDDLTFFFGSKMVEPAEAASAIRRIRQSPALFCLFLLLAPANFYGSEKSCEDGDCHSSSIFIPVGLIVGPMLAGINAAMASSANNGFRKEIQGHDLSGKTLAPGETATGYLVFPKSAAKPKPLMARLKTSTALPPPMPVDPFEAYEAPPARARDFR
jgi:hypothetical protein